MTLGNSKQIPKNWGRLPNSFFLKVFFQPTWDSSDPAGIQQNMLYNISRYDPRELKQFLKNWSRLLNKFL